MVVVVEAEGVVPWTAFITAAALLAGGGCRPTAVPDRIPAAIEVELDAGAPPVKVMAEPLMYSVVF